MTNHTQTHGLEALNGSDSKVQKTVSSVGLDTVFALLSNSRRRAILRILRDNGSMRKGDLVDRVAARELGKDVEDLTHDEHHTVYVSLHQTHLERLEKEDVVQSQGDVYSLGPNADELEFYLRCETESEDRAMATDGSGDSKGLGERVKQSVASFC